jgi:hypothetical protein
VANHFGLVRPGNSIPVFWHEGCFVHKSIGHRDSRLPTRKELDAAAELYEEAVALYEAAKVEFEALQKSIEERLRQRTPPTAQELLDEQSARAKLFLARVRLSRRVPPGN